MSTTEELRCIISDLADECAAERATVERLREAIERAPHGQNCRIVTWGPSVLPKILQSVVAVNPDNCNCWKRDALGGEK